MSENHFQPPIEQHRYGLDHKVASDNFAQKRYMSGLPSEDGGAGINNEIMSTQLDTELALLDSYQDTEMAPVLANALSELKRFAGIGIPKYGNLRLLSESSDSDPVDESELTEDIGSGYVSFGSTNSPNSYTRIQLRPSSEQVSLEDFKKLDPVAQYNASKGQYGEMIATEESELPEESRKLLNDLYELTEATLVRDDGDGNRILKGEYQGSVVYFTEELSNWGHGYNILSSRMLGSESGVNAIEAFSDSDLIAIHKLGLKADELNKQGLTHQNIQGHLGTVAEINAIGSEIDDLGAIDDKITSTFDTKEAIDKDLEDREVAVITTDGVDRTSEISGVAAETIMDAVDERKGRKKRLGAGMLRAIRRKKQD